MFKDTALPLHKNRPKVIFQKIVFSYNPIRLNNHRQIKR